MKLFEIISNSDDHLFSPPPPPHPKISSQYQGPCQMLVIPLLRNKSRGVWTRMVKVKCLKIQLLGTKESLKDVLI